MAMQKQSYNIVTMQRSLANSVFVQKYPGTALSVAQLWRWSMAASLNPPECFQGEIAMLELISKPRTKSCSVESYWLSVRRDSAPPTLTTKPTEHDHLSFNGRPIYANTLFVTVFVFQSIRKLSNPNWWEGWGMQHKSKMGGLKTYSSFWIVFPLSSVSFLWVYLEQRLLDGAKRPVVSLLSKLYCGFGTFCKFSDRLLPLYRYNRLHAMM